ncbi:MAG TPA: mechanosensitive ion channel domain-containing protein [Anaerolineales bacterium]|nr:mechanosensitive ion channel domain-containing protein [Anaerolineales bacterium]
MTSSLILSAIYATVGLGVSFLARRIVHRLMAQVHPTVQTFATKVTFYGILAITGIAILRAWNIESSNLAAILASLGLAVSLSFQDLFRNIIAGVFLLIERPFETGDKLTIGLVTGRVLLVDLRATTLITEDGQRVYVPNQRMISDVVIREQQEKQMEEDQVGKTPRPGGEDSQG